MGTTKLMMGQGDRRLALLGVLLLWIVLGGWICNPTEARDPPYFPPDASDDVADVEPEDEPREEDNNDVEDAGEPDVVEDPYDIGPPPEHVREARPAAQGALQAGVAVGELRGPVGVSMAGYGNRSGSQSPWSGVLKASRGFYGYMYTKAIVLEVEGERVALLKMPTMSGENALTDGIAAQLQARHGIDMRGRILTGATHSHHSPGRYWRLPQGLGIVGADEADEEVIQLLTAHFADVIADAVEDLGPAQWGHAYEDDWDPDDRVYRDRRSVNDPEYPKDPRLSLFAVQRPDGTPMATIINFGMHGTAFGDSNALLSEDAPGGVELKFEEYFMAREGQPIAGLFVQSGGGDASPAGDMFRHPVPARIELIGETAAPKIYDLYKRIEFQSETTLAVRSRKIELRYPWMGYGVDGQEEFLQPNGDPYFWGGWQCREPVFGEPKRCLSVENLLAGAGQPPYREAHTVYLSVARIGDLFMVTLPGEPAYSIVRYLREQMAERAAGDFAPEVMGWGYSQDHLLYLTHPDDWYAGEYESEMSLWGPLAGSHIVDRQMQLVDDMIGGFNGPAFYEERPDDFVPPPFEPRAFEQTTDPDTIDEAPQAAYERTQSVVWAFVGGDPSVGSPRVVVQRQDGGAFVDVAGPAGGSLDNSRYHMITRHTPEPPMGRQVLPERRHQWRVQWEIPHDFPAGVYRLLATGERWDGQARQAYEIVTEAFTIGQAQGAALTLERDGDTLSIALTVPAVPYSDETAERLPVQGWRLMDPAVGPEEPQQVRAPLSVRLLADGAPLEPVVEATFDSEAGRHVADLSQIALPQDAGITVQVSLRDDVTESPVEAPLP